MEKSDIYQKFYKAHPIDSVITGGKEYHGNNEYNAQMRNLKLRTLVSRLYGFPSIKRTIKSWGVFSYFC